MGRKETRASARSLSLSLSPSASLSCALSLFLPPHTPPCLSKRQLPHNTTAMMRRNTGAAHSKRLLGSPPPPPAPSPHIVRIVRGSLQNYGPFILTRPCASQTQATLDVQVLCGHEVGVVANRCTRVIVHTYFYLPAGGYLVVAGCIHVHAHAHREQAA